MKKIILIVIFLAISGINLFDAGASLFKALLVLYVIFIPLFYIFELKPTLNNKMRTEGKKHRSIMSIVLPIICICLQLIYFNKRITYDHSFIVTVLYILEACFFIEIVLWLYLRLSSITRYQPKK